jgi:hypothetical protein
LEVSTETSSEILSRFSEHSFRLHQDRRLFIDITIPPSVK